MSKEYPRIDLTVDAVVFGFEQGKHLSVLLIRRKKEPFKGNWAIPGGFVEVDEPLEVAAIRELKEETGIEVNSLEQLYAFGDPKRDPRKRIVSIAHYTVVRVSEHHPKADDDAQEVKWFKIDQLPQLAFDHSQILTMSFERLKEVLEKRKAGFLKGLSERELSEIRNALA
ncbi:MAG: NUDIX domain-containing protein [Bacteroidia bacterium]